MAIQAGTHRKEITNRHTFLASVARGDRQVGKHREHRLFDAGESSFTDGNTDQRRRDTFRCRRNVMFLAIFEGEEITVENHITVAFDKQTMNRDVVFADCLEGACQGV
jgi:hypothetical protein